MQQYCLLRTTVLVSTLCLLIVMVLHQPSVMADSFLRGRNDEIRVAAFFDARKKQQQQHRGGNRSAANTDKEVPLEDQKNFLNQPAPTSQRRELETNQDGNNNNNSGETEVRVSILDEALPVWELEVVAKGDGSYDLRATNSIGSSFDVVRLDLMSELRWRNDVDQWWNEQEVSEPVLDDYGDWQLSFRKLVPWFWNTETGEWTQYKNTYYSFEDLQDRLNRCAIQFKLRNDVRTWLNCRGDGDFLEHEDARLVFDATGETDKSPIGNMVVDEP